MDVTEFLSKPFSLDDFAGVIKSRTEEICRTREKARKYDGRGDLTSIALRDQYYAEANTQDAALDEEIARMKDMLA